MYLIFLWVVLLLALSCTVTVSLVWALCALFGWTFSIPLGIVVWVVVGLIWGMYKNASK